MERGQQAGGSKAEAWAVGACPAALGGLLGHRASGAPGRDGARLRDAARKPSSPASAGELSGPDTCAR